MVTTVIVVVVAMIVIFGNSSVSNVDECTLVLRSSYDSYLGFEIVFPFV